MADVGRFQLRDGGVFRSGWKSFGPDSLGVWGLKGGWRCAVKVLSGSFKVMHPTRPPVPASCAAQGATRRRGVCRAEAAVQRDQMAGVVWCGVVWCVGT